MNLISLIFSKISGTAWVVIGVLIGGFAALSKAYQKGIKKEQQEQVEREHETLQNRVEIAEDINLMSDGDVDTQLREYIKKRGD